jgi:hypothetical protein
MAGANIPIEVASAAAVPLSFWLVVVMGYTPASGIRAAIREK